MGRTEERAHLDRLLRLLEIEAKEESERARARCQRLTPAHAEAAGISLVDLIVADTYADLGGLMVLKLIKRQHAARLPWTRIGTGAPVALTFQDAPDTPLRGVVSGKKPEHIAIALSSELPDLDLDQPVRIDLSSDEVTIARQKAALTRVRDTESGRLFELRQTFIRSGHPRFDADTELPPIETELNDAQKQAVTLGLQAEDVALIHGPPGTGKTKTIVALIRAAVARGERVLATAPSNLAVDNILERLVAHHAPVVRLGHPARVLRELVAHTLAVRVTEHEDVRLARNLVREAFQLRRKADKNTRTRVARRQRAEMRAEAKQLLKDARRLERGAAQRILDQSPVVCATTSVAPEWLTGRHFDLVIIDEAAQSTEPGSWMPIQYGDRVVLAGDHQQLPPTVIAPEAAKEGFSVSLFERLMTMYGPKISIRLEEQYRMHQTIMGFSSAQMYDGALVADDSVAEHRLVDLPNVASSSLTEDPLEVIDTAGAGYDETLEPDGESRQNPDEATLVTRKVNALLELGVSAEDIGVITPYAAQARLLTEKIDRPEIEIDTVDGFQGREKEAIVISLVRSNPDQELGFLSDIRRMNVALTRARRKLLVIGDSATLSAHPFYAAFFEYAETAGTYRTVWEEPL